MLRTTQRTGANETSSRSHAIVQLSLGGGSMGELTLVDCAGSEWTADSEKHCAKRRKEVCEATCALRYRPLILLLCSLLSIIRLLSSAYRLPHLLAFCYHPHYVLLTRFPG